MAKDCQTIKPNAFSVQRVEPNEDLENLNLIRSQIQNKDANHPKTLWRNSKQIDDALLKRILCLRSSF
jgi:hypothetical protein